MTAHDGRIYYDVEWMSELPELSPDEGDGGDFDRATYSRRRFPTKPLAMAFARKVIASCPIGCAKVAPVCRVTTERVRTDDDLVCWQERGEWWGECGESEEVS